MEVLALYRLSKLAISATQPSRMSMYNNIFRMPDSHMERLLKAGFIHAGSRKLNDAGRAYPCVALERRAGIYVYAVDGEICYIGSAQGGLQTRFNHYAKTERLRTAMRIRDLITPLLQQGHQVEIFTLCPPAIEWNGLP